MSRHHLVSSLATAAIVGLSALTGSEGSAGSTSTAPVDIPGLVTGSRSACAHMTSCDVVDTADVDGDGQPDQVGWRQLSSESVQVRVRTARATLLTSTVDVQLWEGGGAWAGSTHLDHRRGSELLVGSMQGAHTPMYTVLTYRDGKLTKEDSPSPLSPLWQVDAAYGDYMGWWRHTLSDGRVAMTQKIAFRDGETQQFRGSDVTYVWSENRWVRRSSTVEIYPTARLAAAIGGFHVKGLRAVPGLD